MKKGHIPNIEDVKLQRTTYEGSGGTDIFLSYEDAEQEILIGYVRLRIPSESAHRPEVASRNSAIVRELHVFGQTVPVGGRLDRAFQHKGYGSKLMREAERLALEEFDSSKMLVISALGTKNYYSRFGYSHDGPYVSKPLK